LGITCILLDNVNCLQQFYVVATLHHGYTAGASTRASGSSNSDKQEDASTSGLPESRSRSIQAGHVQADVESQPVE
jgi:hypothetical protein